MFEALKGLPVQCDQACWDLARYVELPEIEAISSIVVTGLGAFGHRRDLLRVYTAEAAGSACNRQPGPTSCRSLLVPIPWSSLSATPETPKRP